jgi:hypothetical protein
VSAAETLIAIEHELAEGGGDAYRRHVREDAVIIVPGQALDREQAIAGVEESGGWDEFSIDGETLVLLGDDAALISYRFRGRRGELNYEALLSSAYLMTENGDWKLAFHQQTPVEPVAQAGTRLDSTA